MVMTSSPFRLSLVVLLVFSAVALGIPHAALAQAPTPSAFADQVVNPPADAQKTASGLAYKIVTPGSGTVHPTDTDLVKVATAFWAKETAQEKPGLFTAPTTPILLGRLTVPGLKEGISLMTTGEKRRLWIPEKIAFNGASGKPKGPLMVDIVLLDISAGPQTPPDVAAAPADALTTKSGLASKVLKPGTGTVHPKSSSSVTVHYTGWTPDGKMFDSSVLRGQPATFELGQVIKGWTEGVQLMVAGESRRFWIPGKLAYDDSDSPNVPKGRLVFDVELVAVDGKR
jgi:FKBP-type peptidyl-prolyl cis-trans isomerase